MPVWPTEREACFVAGEDLPSRFLRATILIYRFPKMFFGFILFKSTRKGKRGAGPHRQTGALHASLGWVWKRGEAAAL